jgi:hypothetical protein
MKVKHWAWNSNGCAGNVHTTTKDHFLEANGHHHHMLAPEETD